MKNIFITLLTAVALSIACSTSATAKPSMDKYFARLKHNPEKFDLFLQQMPKGADLHNHRDGASLAENMITYAATDNFCVDQQSLSLSINTQCNAKYLLANTPKNPDLYKAIINAWSMRDFQPVKESSHDHFFNTFTKFLPIISKRSGEMLAETINDAAKQNAIYAEIMLTPDFNASGMYAQKISFDSNLNQLRAQLLTSEFKTIVSKISDQIDKEEATVRTKLQCGSGQAAAGCDMLVRYIYQVFREQQPQQVFAQLLAGFEAATQDARIVGINMVQAEDGVISMRDYDLHMQMVAFLHQLYPSVHISLHAGELVPGLVPEQGLRFHIANAVKVAHAERIGHGVDIAHEDNPDQLLKSMADNQILVEINLISNDKILELTGKYHPLALYLRHNVPLALSTDDPGVLRTTLTEQYKQAAVVHHLSYSTLKNMARNSIYYSFLPGDKLWTDNSYKQMVAACARDSVDNDSISLQCKQFLSANNKAQLQWNLEKQYANFEKTIS